MFENIIDKKTLNSLSLDELKMLNDILKDIPPYDSVKNAEKKAQLMYDTYAKTFEPIVKEHNGNEKDGYSFYIADAKSPYGMWVDSYISSYDNELVIEYNQYIFDLHNWQDVFMKKLQEDSNIFESIYYAIIDYYGANGLYLNY